ncbi:MAG: hypothetical protein ACRECW_18830 [Phyllobacterium sp.]
MLGNAIGTWAGGVVIDHGPGLAFVPFVAALFPVAAIAIAVFAVSAGRHPVQPAFTRQPNP